MNKELKAKTWTCRCQPGDEGNIREEFFQSIIENAFLKADCFMDIVHYKRIDNGQEIDDFLHMLIFDNQLVASIIERRTDFNNIEFIFTNMSYKIRKPNVTV